MRALVALAVVFVACTADGVENGQGDRPAARNQLASSTEIYTRLCVSGFRAQPTRADKDAVRVGPLTFPGLATPARPDHFRGERGRYFVTEVPAVVERGSDVTVSVAPQHRKRLSLFFEVPTASSEDSRYRVSHGLDRVRFRPCEEFKRTQFVGGFIVGDAQCSTLNVKVGKVAPRRIEIGFGKRMCR